MVDFDLLSGWTVTLLSLAYLTLLFTIAYIGDKSSKTRAFLDKPTIYTLSLAVYCSSWTFYGAVGRASHGGWEFLATYLGPIIIFVFGWRAIEKMILISKQQNITTISDFISSRYGKSQSLAVLVTILAVLGTIPYLAMQLKAVAISFNALTGGSESEFSKGSDTALLIALVMGVFAILFGTRQIDATEHHEGLVLAVAFESIIKLSAFLVVGFFVTTEIFDGFFNATENILDSFQNSDHYQSFFSGSLITELLLAAIAVLCMPRLFHVMIVENTNIRHIQRARWLFPVYLVLLSAFVLPIAVAGQQLFANQNIDADSYVLMLPLSQEAHEIAMLAFIGGLSAATSMVIVASITLSTMVCNDIIMPALFRVRWLNLREHNDLGALLLRVRRITIICLMLLAYFYYRLFGELSALSSFGLLAFAAVAQFIPAIIGGIYWKGGTRQGVLTGLSVGFVIWLFTLVIPSFMDAGILPQHFLEEGLFGFEALRPTQLMGVTSLDPLTHGVLWSLSINTLLFIIISKYSEPRLVDRIQSSAFVDIYNQNLEEAARHAGQATVGDLQMLSERFLGLNRTQHAFTGFALQRGEDPPLGGDKATPELIQFTERLLAGVIGASSARIVLASTLRGRDMHIGDVVTIVDEASQALRFNRTLLQSTIENISLGISVVDQQMRLVAWNRSYTEMFEYPEGLICVGRPIEEIFRYNAIKGEYGMGNTEEQVMQRLAILTSGEPHSYERYRPDGTVLEVRGNTIPNGGYVNIYMDITEHKRIEEALRESEQNIRIYTDNVPVLIAYLDTDRRYLFINRAYAETFNLDRHNIAGVPCYKALPADEYDQRSPYIKAALEGKRQKFETRLPKQSGHFCFAEVTYIPHIGEYGDVLGYFTLYQDITERRLAEKALQETNENLELRVRERTHALSVVNKELRKENTIRSLMEDELRQAKFDAEAANLGKTRFLAAASHDLLQPLNAARLFSSALAQQSHSSETRSLIDNLDGSLKAAEELITAILDISKLDAGALEPRFGHFVIHDLFSNLISEFKAMASEKNLSFHYVHSNATVYSDQHLLRRIVQNFLSNAVRYTQHGRITLGVRHLKDHLRIEVWDTGVGIPDSRLNEVFEEFKRIDNPRHSQVQGLGLGLAITDRIARMLHHPLNVRSWPTHGSVFSITIPRGDKSLAIRPKPEQRGWIRSKGLNGINILVIDNEPKILEGMQALLNGWSCQVTIALSAKQAVEHFERTGVIPDVALVDYHLSETDTGTQALKILSQHWKEERPSIVITADRTEAVKNEVNEAGATLLTKPIRPAALRAVISKIIAQQKLSSPEQ